MKGSEFVARYASKGLPAWETAALAMARAGDSSVVRWPLATIHVFGLGHDLALRVATDDLAIGEPGDVIRLPLLPVTAQRIADVFGMMLPTSRLVREIARAAKVRLDPKATPSLNLVPNKGGDLNQYADHSRRVDTQIAGRSGLVSNPGKNIVVGRLLKPGKVVIYGWMLGSGIADPPVDDPTPSYNAPWRWQPLSNVHDDSYVDYSHGVRLVSPNATLDGTPTTLAAILRDPTLSKLLSDEGPLADAQTRYPTPEKPGTPLPWSPTRPTLDSQGREVAIEHYDALYPERG